MKSAENALVGITSIFTHKLRSFLTMLGIVIGVAAVVGTIAVGEGARTLIMRDLEKVGGQTAFMVQRHWWVKKGGTWIRNPSREYLTREDALAVEKMCPSVREVIPEALGELDAEIGKNSQRYVITAGEGHRHHWPASGVLFGKPADWPTRGPGTVGGLPPKLAKVGPGR